MLDPTSKRPWLGLWSDKNSGKFLWRTTLPATGPGTFDYWPALLKHRRSLPTKNLLVLTGPGPFSATRAAVNIANALGYAWDIPVIGVHGPATLVQIKGLLSDLSQTKIAPHFDLERRALPFWPKPVQLGRKKVRKIKQK